MLNAAPAARFTVTASWSDGATESTTVRAKSDSGARKAALYASARLAAANGKGRPARVTVVRAEVAS